MAVRSMARSIPQDENAVSGKTPQASMKANGAGQERRKLSNITNKLQTPLAKGSSANLPISLKPGIETSSLLSGRQQQQLPPKSLLKNKISQPKVVPPAPARNPNPNPLPGKSSIKLSEELEKKAEMWGEEGVEQVPFSWKDMEVAREKMEQGEIEKRIAVAMAYRTPFPSFLPHVSQNVDDEIGDVLKLDPYEEVYMREHPEKNSNLRSSMDAATSTQNSSAVAMIRIEGVEPREPREAFEDILLKLDIDTTDVPPIPDDWHIVRDYVLC